MKIRCGHVSNSSSSSFILNKSLLTEVQVNAIRDHIKHARNNYPGVFYASNDDAWIINESPSIIQMRTWMDNFDMQTFMVFIGVDNRAIMERGE